VVRESQVQPLVLVFEDLHWIDEETQAFLDSLVESLPTARMLLLVNYRPEYEHGWGRKTFYRNLRIDPLPSESAAELLVGLLGADAQLQPLRTLLIQRTEGNPFFIEESVRTLVETNVLLGERGQYRLASPLASVQVPSRVQSVIAARIDRLPPEHKQLLQMAAVIGKDVPYALLRAISETPESELRLGLTHLQSGEFLYETALFPDLEYTFKHALTHEVAYSGMLQERRRAVHGRIAAAIETVYRERVGEHLERLCYHAVRGELWDKAHRYLEQAGLKALARSANRDAAQCFEQALEALGRLPESREVTERGIDLRLQLRSALHPLGEFDRVFDTLRKAAELSEDIGDERRHGRVLSYLAQSFRLVGDYPRAIEAGERALAISQVFGDFGILAPANFHLGQAFFNLGDHRRAAEFHFSNIRALDGNLARDRLGMAGIPLVFSRGHLCWSLAELGRFAEGVTEWQEAMNLAEEVKHPFSAAFARYCGGFLYIRKGEVERAITHLEPGLAMCRSMNVRLDLPFVASFLGLAYAFQGRVSDGVPLLEEAVQEATTLKLKSGQSWLLGMMAYGYMFADRLREADELAERAIALAQEHAERSWMAWAQYFLGQIRSANGSTDLDAARLAFESGLKEARALELRPLVARFELGLGELHRRTRDNDTAYAYLNDAVSNLREMQMPHWLQKAQAELQRLQVEA
jgi:tetratricopeptide (TPR) repeat protein